MSILEVKDWVEISLSLSLLYKNENQMVIDLNRHPPKKEIQPHVNDQSHKFIVKTTMTHEPTTF